MEPAIAARLCGYYSISQGPSSPSGRLVYYSRPWRKQPAIWTQTHACSCSTPYACSLHHNISQCKVHRSYL